jgi:hypothetical protein
MTDTRSYLVSLPVLISVTGTVVTYDIDTSEASEAIAEDQGNLYYEGDLAEDIAAVEADHDRRAVAIWITQLGELAAKPTPLNDADQHDFNLLVAAITRTQKGLS